MKDIDLLGVYLPPGLVDITIAIVVFAPVKLILDRLGADRLVWHRPLFDVSLFVCAVAAVILVRSAYFRSAV